MHLNSAAVRFLLAGAVLPLLAATANAGVTLYTDLSAFNTAAGTTRTINFNTTDSGAPITSPASDTYFPYLPMGGACFLNEQSYYDQALYNFPGGTITVDLPPNTFAAGASWFPWYAASDTLTVNVSAGGVVSQYTLSNTNTAWQHTWIGVVSDKPLQWISFSLNNTYLGLDYAAVNASATALPSCPPPACTAPTVTAAAPSTGVLWPPNHQMVSETIAVATDGGCGSVSCKIISVSSNEPVGPNGDWVITGDLTVDLRAARRGQGSGRIYTITLQCTDSNGNVATRSTTVLVPHDQGN
jgi:hypothetical protein